jgi:hypothetical protein
MVSLFILSTLHVPEAQFRLRQLVVLSAVRSLLSQLERLPSNATNMTTFPDLSRIRLSLPQQQQQQQQLSDLASFSFNARRHQGGQVSEKIYRGSDNLY